MGWHDEPDDSTLYLSQKRREAASNDEYRTKIAIGA
jgi:hypothetical protein